jgi:hypothetical protein
MTKMMQAQDWWKNERDDTLDWRLQTTAESDLNYKGRLNKVNGSKIEESDTGRQVERRGHYCAVGIEVTRADKKG